jgi:hypothetical protein
MPAHDPTGMYRMSLVGEMRYDETIPHAEGYEYILRVGERFPLAVLGECLYTYRIHSTSLSRRDAERCNSYLDIVRRRACERRGVRGTELTPVGLTPKNRNSIRDNGLATNFMESVVDLRHEGRLREAIQTGLVCAGLHPRDPHYYKALLYSVLPEKIRRNLRPSERSTSVRKESKID